MQAGSKEFCVSIRQGPGMALAVRNHMHGLALSEHFFVRQTKDFVAENEHAFARSLEACADFDLIVVAGRRLVSASSLCHHDIKTVLLFHLAISKAVLAAVIGASDFEPDEEIRIINHLHLVGLGVAYTKRR